MLHNFFSRSCGFISITLLVLLASSLFHSPLVLGISNTTKQDQETDRLALLDIKSKIRNDPDGVLTTWNSSLHHCKWEGIECGTRHRRVKVLNFGSAALSGSLSPAVSNLSFLQELLIGGNYLQGPLPPQLGLLSRLKILNVTGNSFQGEIPANISRCLNLEELWLDSNSFEGSIPPKLASLTHLTQLALDSNRLTGDIRVLGNLTSLEGLSISVNGFQGEIPASLGRLNRLTFLSMGGNSFTGSVPSSIYNLSSLTLLSFGGSPLHGTLPDDLGFRLPHLQTLHIMDTRIEGRIPTSLSNLSDIEIIDLSKNRLSGKIPIDGRNLPNLKGLYFSFNQNLGTQGPDDLSFLDSLVNCTQLYRIILSINNLGGELPPSVANLPTKLERLELGDNYIAGPIPSGIDNLVNLQVLGLSVNYFSGRIPDISKLKSLSEVDLSWNTFTGVIPPSLGNLSLLTSLDLGENQLNGTIPSSLGDCSNLNLLDLHGNKLTGEIPTHLFNAFKLSKGLHLQGNQLWGKLPQEIGRLQNLAVLNVSDNKLTGTIPDSLSKCSSLTEVYMSNNSISGSIPESLASLKGVSILDLSSNNLSGQIPKYLSNFNLTRLNLSFNNLEGEVPMKGIFKNTSGVSLAGNARLCGGATELHLPECQTTRATSHSSKKPLLIILLVTISSLLVVVTTALLLIRFCFKRKQQNVSSTELLLGESFLTVSYNTLLKSTDGFSSRALIGMGSFGSVYKGILNTDTKSVTVAVKVINLEHQGSAKSFMRECKALRSIRHRNLISIISACSSIDFNGSEFKALVYEYMPKGNLDEWLHLRNPAPETTNEQDSQISIPQSLNLQQRISIAIDVASALDYLHNDCEIPILHCDLKPSNILLDNDMVAHVGDFGLARLLPEIINQSLSSSVGVQGTVGYAPPEYGLGNQISPQGDVYSYGIILLEMMTAKRPTNMIFQHDISLHDYAKRGILSDVMEVIDPMLLEEMDETDTDSRSCRQGSSKTRSMESVLSVVKVGVECSMESPFERMSIKDAIRELKSAMDALAGSARQRV